VAAFISAAMSSCRGLTDSRCLAERISMVQFAIPEAPPAVLFPPLAVYIYIGLPCIFVLVFLHVSLCDHCCSTISATIHLIPSAWVRLYGSCPEALEQICFLISDCHVLIRLPLVCYVAVWFVAFICRRRPRQQPLLLFRCKVDVRNRGGPWTLGSAEGWHLRYI